MTITTSQLDDIERAALCSIAGQVEEYTPEVVIQLVAIGRAALAWSEARFVTHPGSTQEREATHRLIAALQGTP